MGDYGGGLIPLKLTVNNFLCYREAAPALDFESIHVACLCGDNGHGKSALLDAITFALWGSSRLGDNRNHDDLIHKGQRNMLVELEFESAGDRYRVVRRRSRGRSQGSSDLQISIRNDVGDWRAITGNTIRETQAFIVERIRLDHETFVNTALLRQGDADRFTTSKASDRKRILAEVLDLSYYDGLERRARDRAGKFTEQAQTAASDISAREDEAARRPVYEEERSGVLLEMDAIEPDLAKARSVLDAANKDLAELERSRAELERLVPRIDQTRDAARQAAGRTAQYEERVAESESLICRADEIEAGHASLIAARHEETRLTRALGRKSQLDRLLADQERAIAVEKQSRVTTRNQLSSAVADLQSKVRRIEELEGSLDELAPERERLSSLEKTIAATSEEENSIRRRVESAEGLRVQYDELRAQLSNAQTEITIERGRIETDVSRIHRLMESELRPRAGRLKTLETERDQLKHREQEIKSLATGLEERRNRGRTVDERMAVLEGENQNLRRTMEDTRQKFDLLDSGDVECPLCGQEMDSGGREHLRAEYEAIGRSGRANYESNRKELGSLAKDRKTLNAEIRELEQKQQLQQSELHRRSAAIASEIELARQSARQVHESEAQVERLKSTLAARSYALAQREIARAAHTALETLGFDPLEAQKVAQGHRRLQEELTALERRFSRDSLALQRREDDLRRGLNDARTAQGELGPMLKRLASVSSDLTSGNFAHEARMEAERLGTEIADLGYDPGDHQSAQDSLRELDAYSDLYGQLERARGQIEWDRVQLENATSDADRLSHELGDLQNRRVELEQAADRLPSAIEERNSRERLTRELEGKLETARVRSGVLEAAIARCDELTAQIAALKTSRENYLREEDLYGELALAFGRNGIQALIIEDAIPQLETDANELLGRLTDGRMSMRLELGEGRRVSGTDLPSEELRISIGDEMGTRTYETFSGGEAFRINFALRIALSRLLARRSGAPLPVLFIDEGFGSQDASGQERLIEAIQSIRDDFEKIIVITHIDAIKEAFDTRIQVEKTDMGSTFEVVWE